MLLMCDTSIAKLSKSCENPHGKCFLMEEALFKKPEKILAPPGGGEVHVWNFSGPGLEILSGGEEARARSMLSVEARSAFIRGRSGLRLAASRYRACEPAGIGIGIADGGKPHFSDAGGLSFSLSHSGSHVMAVFSGDGIGFDIERTGSGGDFKAVARRFFRPEEAALIESAGSGGRDVFLRIWTAKEAVLKLSGSGISGGLDRVGSDGCGHATLDGEPVFLRHFSLGGLVGAVASFLPFEVKGWFDL